MKMIIDFIKSWLYYPTLKQWFREQDVNGFSDSRFQYAYKHCRMVRRIEETKKNNDFSEWTCEYRQEPICKE